MNSLLTEVYRKMILFQLRYWCAEMTSNNREWLLYALLLIDNFITYSTSESTNLLQKLTFPLNLQHLTELADLL